MKLFNEDGDPNEGFTMFLNTIRKQVACFVSSNKCDDIMELRAATDRICNEVSIGIYNWIVEVRHEQRMSK